MRPTGRTAEIGEDAALSVPDPRAAAVAAVLALAVLVVCSIRIVPVDERMVVLRLGRSARLRGPGVVTVLPGIDRGVRVPTAAVSARTARWGIELVGLEISRIEARVDRDLVRWAGGQP